MTFRRLIGPLTLAIALTLAYQTYVQYRMVDFDVYLRAADRATRAENLYQAGDGHYQFKYLPAFAVAIRPVTLVPAPIARVAAVR